MSRRKRADQQAVDQPPADQRRDDPHQHRQQHHHLVEQVVCSTATPIGRRSWPLPIGCDPARSARRSAARPRASMILSSRVAVADRPARRYRSPTSVAAAAQGCDASGSPRRHAADHARRDRRCERSGRETHRRMSPGGGEQIVALRPEAADWCRGCAVGTANGETAGDRRRRREGLRQRRRTASPARSRSAPLAAMRSASALRAIRLSMERATARPCSSRRGAIGDVRVLDAAARRPGAAPARSEASAAVRMSSSLAAVGQRSNAERSAIIPVRRCGAPNLSLPSRSRKSPGTSSRSVVVVNRAQRAADVAAFRPAGAIGLARPLGPALVPTTGVRIALAACHSNPRPPRAGAYAGLPALDPVRTQVPRRVEYSVGAHLYPAVATSSILRKHARNCAWKPNSRCFVPTSDATPGDESRCGRVSVGSGVATK